MPTKSLWKVVLSNRSQCLSFPPTRRKLNWYEGSQVPASVCNSSEESELNEDDNDGIEQ